MGGPDSCLGSLGAAKNDLAIAWNHPASRHLEGWTRAHYQRAMARSDAIQRSEGQQGARSLLVGSFRIMRFGVGLSIRDFHRNWPGPGARLFPLSEENRRLSGRQTRRRFHRGRFTGRQMGSFRERGESVPPGLASKRRWRRKNLARSGADAVFWTQLDSGRQDGSL